MPRTAPQWLMSAALILAWWPTTAPAQQVRTPAPPQFVEQPGRLEFSGWMIVRPLQPEALSRTGLGPDAIDAVRRRAVARLEAQLVEAIPETDELIVSLPAGHDENTFARLLMTTGDYEYVEPDWICHPVLTIPDDPAFPAQWHHATLESPLAWDHVTGDPEIIVAVVDGGVALDHPDLSGALVPGYNAEDGLAQESGGDVYDVDGHGTFVAGLAAAIGNNSQDVVGVGWNLSLMPVRYYNSPGGGYLHDLLDGVRWAADHGARCINVSQTGVEFQTVQTTGAYVRRRGSLLFWAAGNDGRDLSWFDWPDVIVVGGTEPDDGLLDEGGTVSAHGLAVDVYAPASDMLSTFVSSTGGLGLGIGSGTSAATPLAAGVCALVWSRCPELEPAQVEAFLRFGCKDLGPPGEDPQWGWGRISSSASVKAVAGVTFFPPCSGAIPSLW